MRSGLSGFAWQNPDEDAVRSIIVGSREVVRTAPTQANRFATEHVIVYIDKGLLTTEAERDFTQNVERMFVATSNYLGRGSDQTSRRTAQPMYYLTNRAGLSHTEPTTRLTATSGVWLGEGFAGYVAYELAPTLNMNPDRLFVKGDRTTVDEEARQWIRDPRGTRVLPFVGSHGMPEGFVADRPNVAAPFYVLGQSFIKYLVQHGGLAAIIQLYEEHRDGTRPIEDDVERITGRDLAQWRIEWLQAIGASR